MMQKNTNFNPVSSHQVINVLYNSHTSTMNSPTKGNKEVNNIYFYLNIFCFHEKKIYCLYKNKEEN